MHRKLLTAALIAAAGFAAAPGHAAGFFDGEVVHAPDIDNAQSVTTRDEVHARYHLAERMGTTPVDGEVGDAQVQAEAYSLRPRELVRSEASEMVRHGEQPGGEV
jgi:hypothetical protein